jgi:ABC-type sugar transport system, periplasmic component
MWVIVGLALVSSALIVAWPPAPREGSPFWIYNDVHRTTYEPFIAAWNRRHPDKAVDLILLHQTALERRLLSGFLSGTPVADLVELERAQAARAFAGPLSQVGFHDLTDRVHEEGLYDRINAPTWTPWISRGRVFGIPHDMNPVLLAYRADIIEAAGIDLPAQVETWDDFYRVLRPLMQDLDGDGRHDRFLLNGSTNNELFLEIILRQAGGRFFDDEERLCFNDPVNARTLAHITTWLTGPRRMCTDAPEYSAAGHKMRLDGTVLCAVIPDWMTGQWKRELPGLSGKLKLMPVPAFTRGGRRTSVYGGSMIGVTKTAPDFEAAWDFANALYMSPESAEVLYRGTGIVSPVKELWSLPIYHQPDPYFCGQPAGALFIAQAPDIPLRTASSYERIAIERLLTVATLLVAYADREQKFTVDELVPEAQRLLDIEHAAIDAQMKRNVFLQE